MLSISKKKGSNATRPRYIKTPKLIKLQFLREVIIGKQSIKDASILYNIKYSTAKTLVQNYKLDPFPLNLEKIANLNTDTINPTFYQKNLVKKSEKQMIRCQYRQINQIKEIAIETSSQRAENSPILCKIIDARLMIPPRLIEIISRIQFSQNQINQNSDDFNNLNNSQEKMIDVKYQDY